MEGNIIQKVLFSDEEVNAILGLCQNWKQLQVNSPERLGEYKLSVRNIYTCDLTNNPSIKPLVLDKVKEIGVNSISLGIHGIHYPEGCFFKRHSDGLVIHKTLVIQLSDAKDYEGGELVVENIITSKELGNVILFPAQLIHEVKKVTRGERYSLVAFLSLEDMGIKEKTII